MVAFNVITAAGRVSTQAEVVPLAANANQADTSLHHSSSSMATLFFVLQGACHASGADDGEHILLKEGDCLHVRSAESWDGWARAGGDADADEGERSEALLFRVELSPACRAA